MPEEPSYTVIIDFTDTVGRPWKEGQSFISLNQQAATTAALEAGQIQEAPVGTTVNVGDGTPKDISTYSVGGTGEL